MARRKLTMKPKHTCFNKTVKTCQQHHKVLKAWQAIPTKPKKNHPPLPAWQVILKVRSELGQGSRLEPPLGGDHELLATCRAHPEKSE